MYINPLNLELNPICYLLTLWAHRFLHISRISVKLLTAGERPAAAHLLKSWVRIPPEAWIFVCCECRVLSGRGLCDELITRPEESYRLCCAVVCDLGTSRIGAPYIYDISNLRVNNNNNGGIMNNSYGRIEGLISLFRIPMGKPKYFFKFYSHFGQGPL